MTFLVPPLQVVTTTLFEQGTVFDMLPMPAFIKNIDLVYTHANDALCDLLGTTADKIVGRTAADLSPSHCVWNEDTDRGVLAGGGVASFQLDFRPPGR